MSIVLQFPKSYASSRDQNDLLQSAEVVIFPGVRVERRNFDLPVSPAPGRSRRISQAAIDEDMA